MNLLTPKENAAALQWWLAHKCKSPNKKIVLEGEPTGIGIGWRIICSGCLKHKDITDLDSW